MNSLYSRSLVLVLSSVMALAACEKKKSDGVSVDKYNELVQKYNDTVDASSITAQASRESNNRLVKLNETLAQFSDLAAKVINKEFRTQAELQAMVADARQAYEQGSYAIQSAETALVSEVVALRAGADELYVEPSVFVARILTQSNALSGVRKEHDLLMKAIESVAFEGGVTPPVLTQAPIVITQQEAPVVKVETGGAVHRDQSGNLTTVSSVEFERYASSLGYAPSVSSDSYQIASKNNGVVGLACSNVDLINVLNDLVTHMKAKMNANNDDLELVFTIDYSGSMGNNIDYVLRRMVDFAQHLESIKASGRGVRVGIVTFGEQGREKLELPLTGDLAAFSAKLLELLNGYSYGTHSTDPGEAIYHGLDIAASGFNFTSQNRQIIAITDEGAYELHTSQGAYVQTVEAKLRAMNVYPLLVRYCN